MISYYIFNQYQDLFYLSTVWMSFLLTRIFNYPTGNSLIHEFITFENHSFQTNWIFSPARLGSAHFWVPVWFVPGAPRWFHWPLGCIENRKCRMQFLMIWWGTSTSHFKSLPSLKLYNSSHLKIGHPNRKVVFQPSIFRGELLVSGRIYEIYKRIEL